MNRNMQSGFTLIELVMVIVILGILAATALPKYIDIETSAKQAVLDGTKGAIQSAGVMLYAKNKSTSAASVIIAQTEYDTANVTATPTDGSCTVQLAYSGGAPSITFQMSATFCTNGI